MADNVTSFRRFSALPANITEAGGLSVEEIKLNRGTPVRDVRANPLAAPRRSRKALALTPSGSDDMRLSGPEEPAQDPYEGPASTLGLLREATGKLAHPLLGQLKQVVDNMPEGELSRNMQGSFAAVQGLESMVGSLREMGDHIFVRLLGANSK
jgi:hypothetical protein